MGFRRRTRLRGYFSGSIPMNLFSACRSGWARCARRRERVAIDGQTSKGSGNTAFGGRGPLHLVRAWAVEQRLVLGQLACSEKSHEIEAIPR